MQQNKYNIESIQKKELFEVRHQNDKLFIENSTDRLLFKLDEALDDIANGRVIMEEELWAELDEI